MGGNRQPGQLDASECLALESLSSTMPRRMEVLLGAEEPIGHGLPLTPRERECIGLIRLGLTDQEIAKVLTVSHGTVRSHVDNARVKLNVKTRAQLAMARISLPDPVLNPSPD